MAKRRSTDDGLEAAFDVEALIDRYTPSDEPCLVVLPSGEILKFQVPVGKAGLDAHLAAARLWYESLPKPDKCPANHPFAGILPQTAAEAIDAYTIATLSVDPKFTQKQALKALKAAWFVKRVIGTIEAHWRTMESVFAAEQFERSKKNSKTPGSGSG